MKNMNYNIILKLSKKINILHEDITLIDEYLKYNEWGLAFEILCTSIKYNNIIISINDYNSIKKVGKHMKMDNQLWNCLKSNICKK